MTECTCDSPTGRALCEVHRWRLNLGPWVHVPPTMTYRQWLVGMAMQGLIGTGWNVGDKHTRIDLGDYAVKVADAVIAMEQAGINAGEEH